MYHHLGVEMIMLDGELIAMLEQRLRQAKAIRDRLIMRRVELQRELDVLRTEVNEIDYLINSTQAAMMRLASSVLSNDSNFRTVTEQKNQEAETFRMKLAPPLNPDTGVLSKKFSNTTIPQAAAIILSECEEALHVNEICKRMVEGGYIFTSQNPTISIAGSLKRHQRFRKVAPNTFCLALREVPSKRAS
jgi:hypothetical protein